MYYHTLPTPTIETIKVSKYLPTVEIVNNNNGSKTPYTARSKYGVINITIDYTNKTVSAGGTTYKTEGSREYTYRLKRKLKVIECSNFLNFANMIKEGSHPDEFWNCRIWDLAMSMTKNKIDKIHCF